MYVCMYVCMYVRMWIDEGCWTRAAGRMIFISQILYVHLTGRWPLIHKIYVFEYRKLPWLGSGTQSLAMLVTEHLHDLNKMSCILLAQSRIKHTRVLFHNIWLWFSCSTSLTLHMNHADASLVLGVHFLCNWHNNQTQGLGVSKSLKLTEITIKHKGLE